MANYINLEDFNNSTLGAFLKEMVFIPSSNSNLGDYQIRDYRQFTNIPSPKCIYDFCISHRGIRYEDLVDLNYSTCSIREPSQASDFVEFLTNQTGLKFEIASVDEVLWSLKLVRKSEPLVSSFSGITFAIDNDDNFIEINGKKGLTGLTITRVDTWIKKKFNGKKVYIGMSPALVIGHPTTLVVSLLLIPVTLGLAVILPGNEFLPLASLAGMFYVFVMVLPFTKGNVVKTFIVGLVTLAIGLWFVTDMAPAFTQAAHTVFEQTGDNAAKIPEGFEAGALDFASSLFGWVIYKCVNNLQWIGMGVLSVFTLGMMWWNRKRIVADEMNRKQ